MFAHSADGVLEANPAATDLPMLAPCALGFASYACKPRMKFNRDFVRVYACVCICTVYVCICVDVVCLHTPIICTPIAYHYHLIVILYVCVYTIRTHTHMHMHMHHANANAHHTSLCICENMHLNWLFSM